METKIVIERTAERRHLIAANVPVRVGVYIPDDYVAGVNVTIDDLLNTPILDIEGPKETPQTDEEKFSGGTMIVDPLTPEYKAGYAAGFKEGHASGYYEADANNHDYHDPHRT